jgi:hypothetical protein
MLAPISARLASSCSRNGISEAATDTICAGATSMYWTRSGEVSTDSPFSRQRHQLVGQRPSLSSEALAWAMTYLPSSMADR